MHVFFFQLLWSLPCALIFAFGNALDAKQVNDTLHRAIAVTGIEGHARKPAGLRIECN